MSTYYEPGKYWGKITRQGFNEASTGTPQFVLSFEVVGQMNPADPAGDLLPVTARYERTAFMPLTEKTIERFLDDLAMLGFEGQSFAELNPDAETHVSFVEQEAMFSCEHDSYEGKTRERWRLASGGGTFELKNPLDAKGYRKLDTLFGKALKSRFTGTKPAAKPAPEKRQAPEPAPVGADDGDAPSDDIPF